MTKVQDCAIGGLHAPARRQLEHGVTEVGREVAGRHRDFPFVGLGEIAGERVQVHGDLAGRFGVEQLRQPRRQARP